jgi:hypothetical protein
MNNANKINIYISLAKDGSRESIDELMSKLNEKKTLAESKFVDYALGEIDSAKGIKIMEEYLFKGTRI